MSINSVGAGVSSGPPVLVPAFVVFESTFDLEWLPPTLVIEDISESAKFAVIELNPSGSLVCDV